MIAASALYIVNYCHPACKPFFNICRLPEDEAFALAYQMAEANPDTTAFGRFADFENYYPRRMKQDEYLYERFVAMGGNPKEKHPLSFVLQGSDYLNKWFGYGITSRVRLLDIPSESISFTLGDSMAMFAKHGELTMYTKEKLLRIVNDYPGTLVDFMAEITEKYSYIEVQLWNDDYCKEAQYEHI